MCHVFFEMSFCLCLGIFSGMMKVVALGPNVHSTRHGKFFGSICSPAMVQCYSGLDDNCLDLDRGHRAGGKVFFSDTTFWKHVVACL